MAALEGRRGALAEHVYVHLKERLLDGLLELETRIPVDDIATELEVSRQPVMDAIKRLAFEGYVSITPQVGSMPRSYNNDEIDDFFKLFAGVESLVAELAAERATALDIVDLKLISLQIGTLLKQPRNAEIWRTYRVLNRRLHDKMMAAARSRAVEEIVGGLRDRSDYLIAIKLNRGFGPRLPKAHQEHQTIIRAIETGDVKGAGRATFIHIQAISDRILKLRKS